MDSPLSQTVVPDMAPSNSTKTRLPASRSKDSKLFRYQPMPAQGSFPVRLGRSRRNGPSIPQSCGRFSSRHGESSNEGDWRYCGSACSEPSGIRPKRANRQPSLKSIVSRPLWADRKQHVDGLRLLGARKLREYANARYKRREYKLVCVHLQSPVGSSVVYSSEIAGTIVFNRCFISCC